MCVSLSEAEWAAFIERNPEPVDWLRKQILSADRRRERRPAAAPDTPGSLVELEARLEARPRAARATFVST